jgi:protocatechuate 3,4-dioxygenase beta subunit
MRRFLFTAAVIVVTISAVTLSLIAQTAPSPSKADPHPAPPCVVSGRVVTASEGNPLKSVRVSLVADDLASKTPPYTTTTDSDGRFLLKDIVPGRYRFFAMRAGFVEQHYQAKANNEGAALSLKSGETVSDVLFRMTVAGVITGRVANEDGDPMVRVRVVALREPSEEEDEDEARFRSRTRQLSSVSSAQTDDRGEYRIFGLKPGEYYIKTTDSFEPDQNVSVVPESYWVQESLGSEYGTVYYPGVTQASQAQTISVKAGDEVQADVFMQHARTADVAGHVIGRSGPATKAWVELTQSGIDDSSGIELRDTTDEKGAFRIKGVPPGSYTIAVFQKDEGEVYEPWAQQKVEVNGENIDSLSISLGAAASFQGRVTVAGAGSPALDQISVNFLGVGEDEQLFGVSEVKKDGTFAIKSISNGNYAAHVYGLEDNWYVKSMRLGNDDIFEKGLQVEKGGPGGRLEIVVSSGSARLEGSVTGPDGAAIGARVRIVPEPETLYNRSRAHSAKTDQAGHFVIAGLVPGKYRVRAQYSASADTGPLRSDPQIITLSESDHKTIELTISPES